LAIVLSVLGGVCELAGRALVVIDIARDRNYAKSVFVPRVRPRSTQRTYPPHVSPPARSNFPSPIHRQSDSLRQLAQCISKVDALTHNHLIDMQKLIDKRTDDTLDLVRTETADADDELRGHLNYILAGSVKDRVIGAVLLGVGILLATAGSVVGNLAT
jgi:hypothetical protein